MKEQSNIANAPKGIWLTKDNRQIPIKDLTDQHLLNILRLYCKQYQTLLDLKCQQFINLPAPNGDMAQMAYEVEMDNLFDLTWVDIVPDKCIELIEEADLRNLDVDNLLKEYYQPANK